MNLISVEHHIYMCIKNGARAPYVACAHEEGQYIVENFLTRVEHSFTVDKHIPP